MDCVARLRFRRVFFALLGTASMDVVDRARRKITKISSRYGDNT